METTDPNINTGSVLALLRGLVPKRRLTFNEALRITELQANRLLEHFSITTVAVPGEIISELPRIKVATELGFPVSGATHWNGRHWIITLSADEHPRRQRFSLMHEFKHIIDHTTKEFLYGESSTKSGHAQAERAADYFAACLLMPKRAVKRLWFEGPQNVEHLANRLQVSPAALRYRLDQLGLTEQRSRCGTRARTFEASPSARASVNYEAPARGSR